MIKCNHSPLFLILTLSFIIDVNSLAPGRCGSKFKSVIFETIQNSSLDTCCEIALKWMLQNLTNEKSTLVQVMAWCRQATSHYLSQDLCYHMVSLSHNELNGTTMWREYKPKANSFLENVAVIWNNRNLEYLIKFKLIFSFCMWFSTYHLKLPSDKRNRTSLMMCQHWFR